MQKVSKKDFPYLNFGDKRRDERFVTIINNISTQPGASIPRQNKSWYDTKATYEFFKNEAVSLDELNKTMMMYGATQLSDELTVLIAHDISTLSAIMICRRQGWAIWTTRKGEAFCVTAV